LQHLRKATYVSRVETAVNKHHDVLLWYHAVPCYAVGFLSRPAGAILFGHLGDTKGRGFCLLLSVLVMGIPTVLIGCLPTYAQAGYASPVLLALLRLIQGEG
jgi:MFS family permease